MSHVEDLPYRFQILALERIDHAENPILFRHDMPGPLVNPITQGISVILDHIHRRIPQGQNP